MHSFTKVAMSVTVVASFGLWGYALSGKAARVAPDTFDDPAFAASLESVCSEAMTTFDALPNAEVAEDNVERAVQITDRNAVLIAMIDDLEAVPATTDRDAGLAGEWLADWRTYVSERQDYADRFAEDATAVAYFSAVGGERIEKRITRLADTNLMFSCETPTDVG
ncbi:MAG: hypothetical protein R2733_24815 [Acidimicrobiales bacterium]